MHLSLWELYTIKTLVSEWYKNSLIARKIDRNRSVLTRLFQKYDRDTFDPEYVIHERTETKKNNSLSYYRIHPWWELASYVDTQIRDWLSPEQVAGSWIKQQEEKWMSEKLSKDTVYLFVYEQSLELIKLYLRRKGKKYRNRKQDKISSKYQIQERRMIDDRPKEIEERKRVGDREWDTIIRKAHKWAILTLVERKTQYLSLTNSPRERMLSESQVLYRNSGALLHKKKEKPSSLTTDESLQITRCLNTLRRQPFTSLIHIIHGNDE